VSEAPAIARINAFRQSVVSTFKEAMPQLRECEAQFGRFDLDALEKNMVRAPAVRVAVLRARPANQPSAEIAADLACAAFVVTEGRDRDETAWTIAEAIAVILHSAQLFGLTRLAAPRDVDIQPLLAISLKNRGVAIVAVEWRQELRCLGETIFDDEKHLLEELYVNEDLWDLSEPAPPGAEGGGDG